MRTVYCKRTIFYIIVTLLSMCVLVLKTISEINSVYKEPIVSTTGTWLSVTSERRFHRHVTKSLAELGKMDEISSHILFFNRIPHSGSEILVLLLQKLQGWNNFRYITLGDKRRMLTSLEEEQLVYEVYDVIKSEPVPLCFDRHVHFINFTKYDKQSPSFFNLIRDPIDNIVSRFNAYGAKTKKFKNLELESCIKNNDPRCVFTAGQPYDLTISYFCGQDPKCMFLNNEWALLRAKENAERYYSVIGTFEELNATLEVFEHKMPYFFKGLQKLYLKELIQFNNIRPPVVNDYVRNYLQRKLKEEFEFYNWIKKRLFRQLQIIYGYHNGQH